MTPLDWFFLHLKFAFRTYCCVVVAASAFSIYMGTVHFSLQYYRGLAGHCFECDTPTPLVPDSYLQRTRTNQTVYGHARGLVIRKRMLQEPWNAVNHALDIIRTTRIKRGKLDPKTTAEYLITATGDFILMIEHVAWLATHIIRLVVYWLVHRIYLVVNLGVALLTGALAG